MAASEYEDGLRRRRLLVASAAKLAKPRLVSCLHHWHEDWMTEQQARAKAENKSLHLTRTNTAFGLESQGLIANKECTKAIERNRCASSSEASDRGHVRK